uniref:Uncharacterized protein AlNc14C143G7302 n=1 Tax=Albugo laibachii Nc14 TaxID=890382 RepID=F0WLB4_9STRA|nr:conserved hypothetical protein [Albugo laibachii Nc14]|eukprot:CCA22077.1 conserved hypothetical protein [Albugo laibachii Nc14]
MPGTTPHDHFYPFQSTKQDRSQAIASILERNPLAFQPKVVANGSETNNLHHLRGCNCRKSNCLKNYCECHQARVSCTNRCACHKCCNTEEFHSAKKMLILSAVAKKQSPAHDLVSDSTGRGPRHSRQLSFDEAPAPGHTDTTILPNLQRKRPFDGIGRGESRNVTLGKASGALQDSNSIFIDKIHDLARGNATITHAQSISTIENLIKTQFEDLNGATCLQHLSQSLLAAAISSGAKVKSTTNQQLEVGCSASHIVQHEREDCTDSGSSLFCHEGSIDSIDNPAVEVRAEYTIRPHEAITEGAIVQEFRDFIRSLSDEQ